MGRGPVRGFNSSEASERSNTVTTVPMSGDHDPVKLHRDATENCCAGIGELPAQAVPHRMGHVNAPIVWACLAFEEPLNALEIPPRPRR
jgi:alanine-glyoxylate transaminase/serine-glyoxylate transaminase/serine-pyruvate transaminase